MCVPVAVAAVAMIASAVSTGVSVYSSVKSGEAQKKAQDYNANIQAIHAKDVAQQGADSAAAQKEKQRRIASTQTAIMGAGGLDTTSGTPLQLLTETAGMGELDALRLQNNASRQAWGHTSQGVLDMYQGNAAASAGNMNAAGSLLGGVSKGFYGAYNAGMFDN